MKKELVFLLGALLLGGCIQSTIAQTKSADEITPANFFAFTGRGNYIYLFNWTTKKCKNTGVKGYDPCLSPDGEKIAFAILESYTGGIFMMDADGSNRQKVTKGSYEGVMRNPQWSSDGKRIFFMANRWNVKDQSHYEWFYGIYAINIDGTEESYIKKTASNYFDLSPDGEKFIFRNTEEIILPPVDKSGSRISRCLSGLWIMNNDGTDCKLIYEKVSPGHVKWSPDGKKIAFEYSGNLYVIDPDGNNFKLIAKPEKAIRGNIFFSGGASVDVIGWTPDSKKIVYVDSIEGPFPLSSYWSINPDGTGKERFIWRY